MKDEHDEDLGIDDWVQIAIIPKLLRYCRALSTGRLTKTENTQSIHCGGQNDDQMSWGMKNRAYL